MTVRVLIEAPSVEEFGQVMAAIRGGDVQINQTIPVIQATDDSKAEPEKPARKPRKTAKKAEAKTEPEPETKTDDTDTADDKPADVDQPKLTGDGLRKYAVAWVQVAATEQDERRKLLKDALKSVDAEKIADVAEDKFEDFKAYIDKSMDDAKIENRPVYGEE